LQIPDSDVRIFGKPETKINRRMGVCLARGTSVEEAREKATKASSLITFEYY
jgi:phosphoribosylglycinamide formyltransferase 2